MWPTPAASLKRSKLRTVWRHFPAWSSRRLCLAIEGRASILRGRSGVPMGLRRTVLRHKRTVFLVVAAVVLAALRPRRSCSVARPSCVPTRPCGESPRGRPSLPATGSDLTRQSIPFSPAPSGLTPREARGTGKNGAPRAAGFASHLTFRHSTFDSTDEILLFHLLPRLASRGQIALGPLFERPAFVRRRPGARARADLLAEGCLLLHRRCQEVGGQPQTV